MVSWPDNPFWDFSIDFYSQVGVEKRLIYLQESLNIDVNLLLYCYWAASIGGQILTESKIRNAVMRVKAWQKETVFPLREVRTKLKFEPYPDDKIWSNEVRNKVKVAELEAERFEQLLLYNQEELIGKPQLTLREKRSLAEMNVTVYLKCVDINTNQETEIILEWLLSNLFDDN